MRSLHFVEVIYIVGAGLHYSHVDLLFAHI